MTKLKRVLMRTHIHKLFSSVVRYPEIQSRSGRTQQQKNSPHSMSFAMFLPAPPPSLLLLKTVKRKCCSTGGNISLSKWSRSSALSSLHTISFPFLDDSEMILDFFFLSLSFFVCNIQIQLLFVLCRRHSTFSYSFS